MSHDHSPPQIPDVTDEAGNTPSWVPMLGIGLLVLFVGLVVLSHRGAEDAPEAEPSEAPAAN